MTKGHPMTDTLNPRAETVEELKTKVRELEDLLAELGHDVVDSTMDTGAGPYRNPAGAGQAGSDRRRATMPSCAWTKPVRCCRRLGLVSNSSLRSRPMWVPRSSRGSAALAAISRLPSNSSRNG